MYHDNFFPVIYAKVPETVKTIPQIGAGVEQNGVPVPNVLSIPAPSIQVSKIDAPTRRSVRQAQRKKRKHGFIPKITIKPIVPPKNEGLYILLQRYILFCMPSHIKHLKQCF